MVKIPQKRTTMISSSNTSNILDEIPKEHRNFPSLDLNTELGPFVDCCPISHAKIFTCFCGSSFKKISNFHVHKRIHTGVLPYTCSHCSKGFKAKGNKDDHERRHNMERPFQCPVNGCVKAYYRKIQLIKHHAKHHSDVVPTQQLQQMLDIKKISKVIERLKSG